MQHFSKTQSKQFKTTFNVIQCMCVWCMCMCVKGGCILLYLFEGRTESTA